MGAEGTLQFSAASVVEDVLQQKRKGDIDMASRKAEEDSGRRYEAAAWLRKIVGVVGAKDLPAEPSEEEFRLGLRSGIILCNVLNKVQPGAVPKVVAIPSDDGIPDGAALSVYQYFENVRNFLVALEEMGIPTFEASDLEKGGNSSRTVNSVLALKSYGDWKQGGGHGVWKFGGNSKPSLSVKQIVRNTSEQFTNSHSRSLSIGEVSLDGLSAEQFLSGDLLLELNEMGDSHSLHMLVRELISDKKQEEIPIIVENMLSKVMAEFEQRLANQIEQIKTTMKFTDASGTNWTLPCPASGEIKVKTPRKIMNVPDTSESLPQPSSGEMKTEDKVDVKMVEEECCSKKDIHDEEVEAQALKQKMLVKQQHRDLQALKLTVSTARADMQLLQMKYQEEVQNLGKHLHGLAHAASGYQKVLEENRKLYNQVQDLKGSIRVYCRVRPFLHGDPNRSTTVDHVDERSITIATPSKYGKDGKKSFTFNKVFGPSATQGEVFSDTQPLIRSVLDGYNVCIFAYGQTGAGKTYTMSGPDELTEESMGVNYRALNDLFLISEQRKNVIAYDISVQMTEIYNEQIRDLLATDGLTKRLEIRNSSQKGINVPNANLVPVTSTNDVINLMNLGQKNRAVSATAMNGRSSRSHSCLTIHVQGRDLTSGTILRGCMHLVDLAGSERVDKSEVVGDRLKEAQHINKSLAALGDVISSLAQKNAHVPYRNSKLTQLLQDSLGGQAKTLMFVHISPEHDDIGETISTLKFAERVSTVELGAARANKDSSDVKELKEQIASLKAALARKEGESGHQSKSVSATAVSSTSHHSWQSVGNMPGKEDVDNVEVRNNSGSRRKSFDPQDIMNSPTSPLGRRPGLRVSGSDPSLRDWVDKNVVNKQDGLSSNENSPLGRCIEEKRQLPDLSNQDCDVNRSRGGEAATTNVDESDEHEATASDGSDPDSLPQVSVPKPTNTPNVAASKLKKPSPRQLKSPELRSLAPPLRKVSNGAPSPLHKNGRQALVVDVKRKVGRVK